MTDYFVKSRLYVAIAVVVVIYICTFAFSTTIWIAHTVLITLSVSIIIDGWHLRLLGGSIEAKRSVGDPLSLGDHQYITYKITKHNLESIRTDKNNMSLRSKILNHGLLNGLSTNYICGLSTDIEVIDELPIQLQHRSFLFRTTLSSHEVYEHQHHIQPLVRGLYNFGQLYLYISSGIGLLQKQLTFHLSKNVEVHPSWIQVKKFDLQVFNHVATLAGIKRTRKIGKTDEFEHVKSYTQGDHLKSINWKATSRRNTLMVNQYQDTQSQSVYCIIDKGRSMKMPFDGLALLDYAINSSLVISNIALKKYDRVGLLTFNEHIHTFLRSNNRSGILAKISESLYREQTSHLESNYQELYFYIRQKIKRRSVLILYTNFENVYEMRRALPYLKQLNKLHLLVTIFFTNTELLQESQKETQLLSDIYQVTFAKKALIDKELILDELASHGINGILSTPQALSITTINTYLAIKAKRMI